MKEILLANGRGVALVDDADYELVMCYKWHLHCQGGAACYVVGDKRLFMHRLIMQPQPHESVDHINHDKLDNRRCNLRLATHAQNMHNKRKLKDGSSRFKGVSRRNDRPYKKWRAEIMIDRRKVGLGHYPDEIDAALAYDRAARRYHGEFALPNFRFTRREVPSSSLLITASNPRQGRG